MTATVKSVFPPPSQAGPGIVDDVVRGLMQRYVQVAVPASQQPLRTTEPVQRGFIIGGVRL